MAPTPVKRSGTVVCHPSGERWTVELQLDEQEDGQSRRYGVFVNRTFAVEAAAREAGEQVVRDWEAGRVAVRDLMLGELAATYRKLRETYQRMQPPSVPTTRAAWEGAISTWEECGWMSVPDLTRLREHVRWAFEPEAGAVRRRRLRLDAEPERTP